jgi:hypothetical protein
MGGPRGQDKIYSRAHHLGRRPLRRLEREMVVYRIYPFWGVRIKQRRSSPTPLNGLVPGWKGHAARSRLGRMAPALTV